ncbi:MAG: hypoxanthine phosphoribosyltransferase, partial [Bacteroidota bacterium]
MLFLQKKYIMSNIKTLHHQDFKIFIPEAQIQARVQAIGQQIVADYAGKNPLFIGVLNGAFVFAADLLRACEGIDATICFTKLASYKGTTSTGTVHTLIGLDTPLKNRHIIIIEDIIDTGKTLSVFLEIARLESPASIALATCLLKPTALQYPLQVDYCCFEIPN